MPLPTTRSSELKSPTQPLISMVSQSPIVKFHSAKNLLTPRIIARPLFDKPYLYQLRPHILCGQLLRWLRSKFKNWSETSRLLRNNSLPLVRSESPHLTTAIVLWKYYFLVDVHSVYSKGHNCTHKKRLCANPYCSPWILSFPPWRFLMLLVYSPYPWNRSTWCFFIKLIFL